MSFDVFAVRVVTWIWSRQWLLTPTPARLLSVFSSARAWISYANTLVYFTTSITGEMDAVLVILVSAHRAVYSELVLNF